MSRFCVLFVLTTMITACQPASRPGADSVGAKAPIAAGIVNGTEVPPQHPLARHVVGLHIATSTGFDVCTGVLLGQNIVLTAAHCVPDQARIDVVFGLDFFHATALRRPVNGAMRSPYWGKQQFQHTNTGDIALIRYSGNTPPGYLPLPTLPVTRQHVLQKGATVLLAGYGRNNLRENFPPGNGVLRMTQSRLSDLRISGSELVVDSVNGQSPCEGDSGGPGIILLENQAYVWGVASRGSKSCDAGTVYTKVPTYELWLQKAFAELVRQSRGGRNNTFNGS